MFVTESCAFVNKRRETSDQKDKAVVANNELWTHEVVDKSDLLCGFLWAVSNKYCIACPSKNRSALYSIGLLNS